MDYTILEIKKILMNTEELIENIRIVFFKELNDTLIYKRNQYVFIEKKGKNNATIIYENSDVLINIFSNIQNNEEFKKIFFNEIQNIANNHEQDTLIESYPITVESPIPLGFYTFLQLGNIDLAIELYKNKTSPISIIPILSDILELNPNYFNNKQLGKLLNIIGNIKYDKTNYKIDYCNIKNKQEKLITFIIDKRFENVKQQIKGINLEINQDRKEVSNIIKYLEFDERYNHLLNDIDKYIYSETSNATSAAMIGNLRVFLSDIIVDLAKRISKETNEKIPHEKERGEIGDARYYLKDKLKLHDKDNKLINDFVEILHEQGGHSFISSKKYFRLTRNMIIEIVLFLLSKYKEYKKIK